MFVSIVVPVYNEEEVLQRFHERLSKVLDTMVVDTEIVYINDGSGDSTLKIMQNLYEADTRVAILDLSRNFGKEIALSAGIDHANGEAVISIC